MRGTRPLNVVIAGLLQGGDIGVSRAVCITDELMATLGPDKVAQLATAQSSGLSPAVTAVIQQAAADCPAS